MTNLLILLTFPEEVRNEYRDRVQAAFPGIQVDLVARDALVAKSNDGGGSRSGIRSGLDGTAK